VGRERDASAEEQGGEANGRIEVGEGGCGQKRAGRDADEGVDHVPGGIDGRDFVGDELDDEERAG